jgi:hypothetical protein
MNIRRGLLRLWLVIAVVWTSSGTWLLWDSLSGKWTPEDTAEQASEQPPPPEGFVLTTVLDRIRERRVHAFQLILVPPLGLFAFICAGFWVARGFRS